MEKYYFFEWGTDSEGGFAIMQGNEVFNDFGRIPRIGEEAKTYEKDYEGFTCVTKYFLEGIFNTKEEAENFADLPFKKRMEYVSKHIK